MGFEIRNDKLIKYTEEPGMTEIRIPKEITRINHLAFSGCRTLVQIGIPEGVKRIGSDAFRECTALESIIIPEGIDTLYSNMFIFCSSLKSVVLPESLETISTEVFRFCTNLESICIPDNVKHFGARIFKDCTKLNSISYCGITFNPHDYGDSHLDGIRLENVFSLIKNHDFSLFMNLHAKYDIIFKLFLNQNDAEAGAYIRSHFLGMFRFLIAKGDLHSVQKILDLHQFVRKGNIDKFIQYAIDKQKHEIYLRLLEYKDNFIGYQPIEEKFRL